LRNLGIEDRTLGGRHGGESSPIIVTFTFSLKVLFNIS